MNLTTKLKIYKVNGEIKPVVVGYLSILFSISDRINKQKNLVRIEDLNTAIIIYDLFDIYRATHSVNTLSFQVRMEYSGIPEHKAYLRKF